MGTLYRAIELTRNGARAQWRTAENMTREAVGQGLAIAGARAMGRRDSGRAKEQVDEKLHQAELKDRDADMLDRSEQDLNKGVQSLQVRINRYDQMKREQRRMVDELGQEIERAKQEVAARREEAARLEALREFLRWREEDCNEEIERLDNETLHQGDTKETSGTERRDKNNNGDDEEEEQGRQAVDGGNHNKEAEGVMGDDVDTTITSGAYSNKEAGPGDGNDGNETNGNNKRRAKNERRGKDHAMKIAKTHKEADIGDDDEEEQGRQMADGGKDIQARKRPEEEHRGNGEK